MLRSHEIPRSPTPSSAAGQVTRDRVHAELHFKNVTCFERSSSYYENVSCVTVYSVTVYLHGSVSTQHGSFELEWRHHDVLG